MKVAEAIALGWRTLPRSRGIPDPRREARWLLARAWGIEEIRLVTSPRENVPEVVLSRYRDWLDRRARGEPAHHLTGVCTFWGRRFAVSPAVLIPRPETELLVEAALDVELPSSTRALDVGTGSGCLAVTLALERPAWQVVAVDASPEALVIASGNAASLGAVVRFVLGDLSAPLAGGFDLVVANLPYVPTGVLDDLPAEVRHEPRLALDGGGDGLELVRRLVRDLSRLLVPGGWAILELGEDQARSTAGCARRAGLAPVRTVRDLGGCERVLLLRRAAGGGHVTG
ncbi:MAG: peptide chain release factor N(5)-glutamine methyltransferase [Acidobacteria bacterium]|nr:peptide chain release factor N(5)-glutamine methyltransferase [Acidobacteriota bacterium]